MVDAESPGAASQPEVYKKVRVLGSGSFGKAFLVRCASDSVSAPASQSADPTRRPWP